MITKRKIAARVLTQKAGGQVSSLRKIDPREVYEHIETVRNLMMEKSIRESGHLDGEFVSTFRKIPVLHDTELNEKYSILPTRLISFSDFDGIRQVSAMKKQSTAFVKLENGSDGVYSGLEAYLLHGNAGYYTERTKTGNDTSIRIVYRHLPSDYDKVLIKMVASVYDFDEDEALPIPAAHEEELFQLVNQAFNEQEKTPIDTKEDNAPNQ